MLGFIKVIGNKEIFVELQLLQLINIYNIFYLNLLQKVLTTLLTNQVNKPFPLVIINNKKKWEVENILDTKS